MADDRIQCKKCAKKIVPRLFREGGNIFQYPTIQHMCPFCGTVQYETGGDMNLLGKIVIYPLVVILALGVLRGCLGLNH